tara:strand:- start:5 stop:127 length:123 start_codon:yes stop_codon:yes gene_type:complete
VELELVELELVELLEPVELEPVKELELVGLFEVGNAVPLQ